MVTPMNVPLPAAPASKSTHLSRALRGTPPALTFAVFCFIGLATLLLSFAAHTNGVMDPRTSKLFGYLYEINWAANYVLIIPIAIYFCTAAINGMSQVITELAQARMIVRDDGVAASTDDIKNSWNSYARPALWVAGVLGCLALTASMIEWWTDCVRPLSYGSLAAIPATVTPAPGWNLTSLLSPGQAVPLAVASFGAVAFLGQAAVVTAFLSFITLVLAFASWVFRYTSDDSSWELFPNPAASDKRRGFEHFEIFIENLLLAALALLIVFFMTRLQYLYNDSDARSIVSFVSGDVAKGFFQGLKKLVVDADPIIFTAGKRIPIRQPWWAPEPVSR
jgi:hypothetical protein